MMAVLQVLGNRDNLLVTAATGQMMVYNNERLVWAAKGDTCPVVVKVATFGGLPGSFMNAQCSRGITASQLDTAHIGHMQ